MTSKQDQGQRDELDPVRASPRRKEILMDRTFGPTRPGPLAPTLAALIGGEMVYEPAIDDYVIQVGNHILTWNKGAIILDAHSPAAVELGRHSEGADRLAVAFRMATTGVAA